MASPTHLLVANPTAQSGRNAARIDDARRRLEAHGIGHDFLPTRPAGETVDAVAECLRSGAYAVVVSMGGDGTFAEVAKGLLRSGRAEEIRLGMLPTGTANDQGKSFGLSSRPEDLERNVAVIAEGRELRLDAGRIRALDANGAVLREDWFFDSAGWGISPRVLALRNEDRRAIEAIPVVRDLWRDKLVYAGALVRTFVASYVEDDKFDAEVVLDGGALTARWEGLTDLIVKATRIYGGLWVLDPTSRPDDGLFEIVPFVGKRDWAGKALLALDHEGHAAELLSRVGVVHSAALRGSRFALALVPHAGGPPLAAQIDGEEFPASARAEIEVVPRVLRLLVPASVEARSNP